MERPTIQTALVWSAMVALCVAGTVYEFPSAISSLRRHRYVFGGWKRNATSLVPDRLVAQDPEAGAILRYVLAHRFGDPNVAELRDLVAEHPQNEFFLSELAEALNRCEHADPNGALATANRLLTVTPNNAHAHYLRAWVLLEAPEAKDHLDEILTEFEQADHLPEFYLPYGKYKDRIARLAREAGLPGDRRPWVHPWPYIYFGSRITSMPRRHGMDQPSFRQLLTSATHMADRVITNSYGLESLTSAPT